VIASDCAAQRPLFGWRIKRLPDTAHECEFEGPAACPAHGILEDRLHRQLQAVHPTHSPTLSPVPDEFVPWWQLEVGQPQRDGYEPTLIELDTLLRAALEFSPRVQAIRETEIIRNTAIVEAEAEFDIKAFMESKFARSSDPVGNDLTTGGTSRYRDSDWFYSGGARKRTPTGATFELSQQLGYRDNNSRFLNPTQQGNSRLSLSFTQPLLNGAGRAYNQSQIILAQLDSRTGRNEVVEGLQRHLVEVTEAYWDLYLHRILYKQKQHHHDRARQILKRLQDRRGVDALQSQILSAQAAVAGRFTELNLAATEVQNTESRLRTLVSSPDFFDGTPQELIPSTRFRCDFVGIPLQDAMATALYYRPDIDVALQQTKMAAIRLDMSTHQLLPVLNVVLETYVAGLEGRSRIDQAWENQFTQGEPGYTAGLLFEVPVWNRAAAARNERSRAELRQLSNELKATVDEALLEVEIAVRAVETAYRDILANYYSMVASQEQVDVLQDQWSFSPGDNRSASLMLEDLLQAQDRLASAEFAFAASQVAFMFAQVKLKQVMGVLLIADDVPEVVPWFEPSLPDPPPVVLQPEEAG
jgi:outer membrane protein